MPSTHCTAKLPIDGILPVRKPSGWTSHDVVAKLRSLLGGMRVGHAGTLDPAATGLLPILLGKATRLAEYLLNWDKDYRAILRLGETTDTQDATGRVLRHSPVDINQAEVRSVVRRFEGRQRQLPPMYSAVKVAGSPLYKSARAGKEVDRPLREVVIHSLQIEEMDGRDITMRISCSKGTYIRTLCADIGEALGVGGHLRALERTRVGPITLARAVELDEILDRLRGGRLADRLLSLNEVLEGLPGLTVDHRAAARIGHGIPIGQQALTTHDLRPLQGQRVRLLDTMGELLAIGLVSHADGVGPARPVVSPLKVFVDPAASGTQRGEAG